MTKIQSLAFVVTLFQCIFGQGYDVQVSYGTQATVSEPGQQVVSVPVFLLSEKKRKPRQRLPTVQKPLPPFGLSQSQVNNNFAKIIPFHGAFPKPPLHQPQTPPSINQPIHSFPPTRNVLHQQPSQFSNNPASSNFNGQYRTHSPPPQQHRHKIQNHFDKPPSSQSHFNQPPSPVPPYQTNFVKLNANLNPPSYHKPVPPSNFNKQSQSHNQRQKPRAPAQTLYASAPQYRKPSPPSQSNYRKPSYSQPPHVVSYDKPPSVYVKPPTSYTISSQSQRPSYNSQSSGVGYSNSPSSANYNPSSPSYNTQSSSSFSAPSPSAYSNPGNSFTSSAKPSAVSGYASTNYASSVNYSPSSYNQPSNYESTTYNTEVVQNPDYSSDDSSPYSVHQSSYSLPTSKVTQFSRPSSDTTLYDLPDEVKASESSETSGTEEGEDDTTVSYKVVYIPLEVLKTILSNSGLK